MDASALGSLAGSLARAGLPALGTILGVAVPPPWNLMVGPAFAAISAVLGVDPAAPDAPAQVQAKVDADPAGAVDKLQTIEQAHRDAADAANEELRLRLADVQDARSASEHMVEAGSPLAHGAAIVSIVITVGFMALLAYLLSHPSADTPLINVMLGTLAAAFTAVVNYWLGSSAGSHIKTQQLADLAKSPTVNAQPGAHVSAGTIRR